MIKVGIVGTGIIGAFAAFYFLRRKCTVVLIDQFKQPFHGSTGAGFGSLTPFSDPFFKGAVSHFADSSVKLYRKDILPTLGEGSFFLSEDSLLQLFEKESDLEQYKNAMGDQSDSDSLSFRIIDRATTRNLEPNITSDFCAAIEYFEPWLDMSQLLPLLQSFLSAQPGCRFEFGTCVSSIVERSDIVGVNTADGRTLDFDAVVVATGPSLSRIHGLPSPRIGLIRGDGASARSLSGSPLVKRHVYMGSAFVTPRLDGNHLLGATYEKLDELPMDASADNRLTAKVRHLSDVLTSTMRLIPKLSDCEIGRVWHGWRPVTPSGVPYVGLIPGRRATWAALGFIGLGVTLAPAVGKGLCEAVLGEKNGLPPEVTSDQEALWELPDGR